jgi:hypothetical protein
MPRIFHKIQQNGRILYFTDGEIYHESEYGNALSALEAMVHLYDDFLGPFSLN